MFSELMSHDQLEVTISENPAVLVYFSNESCSVCKSLKPKVEELVKQNFDKMKTLSINADSFPAITGQYRIFTLPAILVFFNGKETIRKVRNFSIREFGDELQRPYSILFTS
ncbi:MAG TPA: thioredoxin family protein [Mariniphaga sp.]|nr:thioredoxin family protein [Mariniphaga sp.]